MNRYIFISFIIINIFSHLPMAIASVPFCFPQDFSNIGAAAEIDTTVVSLRKRKIGTEEMAALLARAGNDMSPELIAGNQYVVAEAIQQMIKAGAPTHLIEDFWSIGNLALIEALSTGLRNRGFAKEGRNIPSWRLHFRKKLVEMFQGQVEADDMAEGVSPREWESIFARAGMDAEGEMRMAAIHEAIESMIPNLDRRQLMILQTRILREDPTTGLPFDLSRVEIDFDTVDPALTFEELTRNGSPTMDELGDALGVTRERIRQIELDLYKVLQRRARLIAERGPQSLVVISRANAEQVERIRALLKDHPRVADIPRVKLKELPLEEQRIEVLRQYKLLMQLGVGRTSRDLAKLPEEVWKSLGVNFSPQSLFRKIKTLFGHEANRNGYYHPIDYVRNLAGDSSDGMQNVQIRYVPGYEPDGIVYGNLDEAKLAWFSNQPNGYAYLTKDEKLRDIRRQLSLLKAGGWKLNPTEIRRFQNYGSRTDARFFERFPEVQRPFDLFNRIVGIADCERANNACIEQFLQEQGFM